jgi:hypothetical protein
MAVVEIAEVGLAAGRNGIRGFVDYPRPGLLIDGHRLPVVGWVLSNDGPVVAMEVDVDKRPVAQWPLGVERPDLAAAFPDLAEAGRGGFRGAISLLGDRPEIAIELRAVLPGGARVPFA